MLFLVISFLQISYWIKKHSAYLQIFSLVTLVILCIAEVSPREVSIQSMDCSMTFIFQSSIFADFLRGKSYICIVES